MKRRDFLIVSAAGAAATAPRWRLCDRPAGAGSSRARARTRGGKRLLTGERSAAGVVLRRAASQQDHAGTDAEDVAHDAR